MHLSFVQTVPLLLSYWVWSEATGFVYSFENMTLTDEIWLQNGWIGCSLLLEGPNNKWELWCTSWANEGKSANVKKWLKTHFSPHTQEKCVIDSDILIHVVIYNVSDLMLDLHLTYIYLTNSINRFLIDTVYHRLRLRSSIGTTCLYTPYIYLYWTNCAFTV